MFHYYRTAVGDQDQPSNDATQEHAGVWPADATLEHPGHPAADGTQSHLGHLPEPADGTRSHIGHLPEPADGTRSHLGHLPEPADGTRSHLGHLPEPADGTRSHAGVFPDAPAPSVPAPSSRFGTLATRGTAVDWQPGDVVDGRYEILAVAGRGGMGIVHRVRHRVWNVELAVKTPLPHVVANARARERYVQEAETWVDLGLHPNIVQCWFVSEIGGLPRLFLDYIAGGSLKDWMHAGHARPGQWAEILDLIVQACDGLSWSHARGMVHRDIKPGNLMVAPDGTLYVTDFGLVKRLAAAGAAPLAPTASGGGGTPAYGAPEQWLGQEVDGRADVYALGITLFEMSTGTRPFDDSHHPEPPQVILGRHLMVEAPDARERNPAVPPALAELIARCLKKQPADRPAGADALRAELAALQAALPGAPPPRAAPEVAAVRADGFNNRGVSLAELGKQDQALESFEHALAVDRHHAEALFNQTLLAWRQGRLRVGEAVGRLEAARPSHPRVGFYLAQLHLEALHPAAAERELRRVLDLFGPDQTARRVLAHSLMCQEKFTEAAQVYATVLERAPGDGEAVVALELARARDRRPDGRLLFPRGRRMLTVTEGKGGISALAVSPVAPLAVTGGENSALLVWDLREGTCTNTGIGHAAGVTAVAIAADGRRAVSASRDATLRLWSLPDGQWIRVMSGHQDEVTAVALGADGRTMVSGCRDRTARVWDLDANEVRHVLQGHPGAVTALEISPDGRLALAACEGDGAVLLWDLASGALSRRYDALGTGRMHLVPLPDGTTGLLRWDASGIALYGFGTGLLMHRFEGHAGQVHAVTVSRDGRIAVSTGADDTLRAWDVAAGAQVALLRGHDGARTVALTGDLATVVLGSPRAQELAVWELEADVELLRPGLAPNRARSFTETRSLGHRFATQLNQARADFAAGRTAAAVEGLAAARALAGYERDAAALALNADLAAAGLARGVVAGFSEGALTVCAEPAPAGQKGAPSPLLVAPGPDGAPITAGARGEVTAVEVTTGVHRVIARAHNGAAAALGVSADGRLAAVAPGLAAVAEPTRVFDLLTGVQVTEVPGHDEPAHAAHFTADARWLVTAALAPLKAKAAGELTIAEAERARRRAAAEKMEMRETELRVWNLEARSCERVFEGLQGRLVAVAPSGRFALLAAGGGAISMLDLADGVLLHQLAGHFAPVAAVAILPGEARALSAGTDRAMRLWDLATGACLGVSELAPGPLAALALAPGGHHAAAACADGSLVIVGTQNAGLLATLPFSRPRPTALAFLEGGRRVAVAEAGGELHVVGLDWLLDAAAPSVTPPAPPPSVDLTAPRPPLKIRVHATAESAAAPPLPLRARIAFTACGIAALLAPVAAGFAFGATWVAAALLAGGGGGAIAYGAHQGQPWARAGAMAAALTLAAAAGWAALSLSDELAQVHALFTGGLLLGLPAAALLLAVLVHGFRGEWEPLDLAPPPVQVGVVIAALSEFVKPFHMVLWPVVDPLTGRAVEAALSPVAVQVGAVAGALVALAILDALRSPDTEAWFEWRERRRAAR